jgi:hypothetical protein
MSTGDYRIVHVANSALNTKPLREGIERIFGVEPVLVLSVPAAREALATMAHLILLDPIFISLGSDPQPKSVGFGSPTDNPEYNGRRILTDIIRAEGSINQETPVIVRLTGKGLPGYTAQDYATAGANYIFETNRLIPVLANIGRVLGISVDFI